MEWAHGRGEDQWQGITYVELWTWWQMDDRGMGDGYWQKSDLHIGGLEIGGKNVGTELREWDYVYWSGEQNS